MCCLLAENLTLTPSEKVKKEPVLQMQNGSTAQKFKENPTDSSGMLFEEIAHTLDVSEGDPGWENMDTDDSELKHDLESWTLNRKVRNTRVFMAPIIFLVLIIFLDICIYVSIYINTSYYI